MEMGVALQMVLFAIVAAAGKGFTVTATVLVLTQLLELVSVIEYVVETVGDTVGFEDAEVKPTGLLIHEYVLPVTAVAPIAMDVPVQILELDIVAATGSGFTVILTVLDFIQPFEFVSTRVYVAVAIGDTEGFELNEPNPFVLVHEYELPATAIAPIDIDEPVQMLLLAIVAAAGKGFTVIKTEFELIHPLEFVSVRVYVVVIVGETVGFDVKEPNPNELVHEYELPMTLAAPIEIVVPEHIVALALTAAAGNGLTVIITELVLEQPFEPVSVSE
jgi:hypothetical protein